MFYFIHLISFVNASSVFLFPEKATIIWKTALGLLIPAFSPGGEPDTQSTNMLVSTIICSHDKKQTNKTKNNNPTIYTIIPNHLLSGTFPCSVILVDRMKAEDKPVAPLEFNI